MFIEDRSLGAMYGLLVGDAFGGPFEFMSPDEFALPKAGKYAEGGMHSLEPGEWTDDGSMALAMADSLRTGGFDLEDQMRRYVDWMYEGRYTCRGIAFDIGNTTRRSLDLFHTTGDPDISGEPEGYYSSGNGSIMRLAPVPIYAARTFSEHNACDKAYELGAKSSHGTHQAADCVMSCAYMSYLICSLITSEVKVDDIFDATEGPLWPGFWDDMDVLLGKIIREPDPAADGISGYVIDTLEAALWAVKNTDNFDDAIIAAVSLGGDSDTVGAVTGQIAGAAYGIGNIHPGWIKGLSDRLDIAPIINGLVKGESECLK